jgi:CRISPR-associated endonuclease Cas1
MAATQTVSQLPNSRKSPISKSGVLTIHGFGVNVRVQSGHLEIEDGVCAQRRKIRLARVGHNFRRLVCISKDGFVTFSALKWLSDVGASFIMLDSLGKIRFITGPCAPSQVKLRRAQALAFSNGVGLEISRALIGAKLQGQERVVRERLKDSVTADIIARFRDRLPGAKTVEVVRTIEAHAAVAYFGAWRDVPVLWPKADRRRIPEHWHVVGTRQSPLSGGPRLAVTPVHAILNYGFALLESESRLAVSALGLDPGLGLGLHTDTPNRDSLALDVLEPVRPEVETWLLNWITSEPLRRSDFFETSEGNCRLMAALCEKLSETAPVWGKLVAPWAEYVARALSASARTSKAGYSIATRLTQQHRREARGRPGLPRVDPPPRPQSTCRVCGTETTPGTKYCGPCAAALSTKRLVSVAKAGRLAAHSAAAEGHRADTQRSHALARWGWRSSSQPAWLTEDAYITKIQPQLAGVTNSAIAAALGVSLYYAAEIRRGRRRPHPRHWLALVELVGVSQCEVEGAKRRLNSLP